MTDSDLTSAVREMTSAFGALEAATSRLLEAQERDMAVRRWVRWATLAAASLLFVIVLAVGGLALLATRTADDVRAVHKREVVSSCLRQAEFRSDMHLGIRAVLEDVGDYAATQGWEDSSWIEGAMEALAERLPASQDCPE